LPALPENPYLVVLSDIGDERLPESLAKRLDGYRLTSSFFQNEAVFRYNVGIKVYQKRLPFQLTRRAEVLSPLFFLPVHFFQILYCKMHHRLSCAYLHLILP
jgi:hypothetical protein